MEHSFPWPHFIFDNFLSAEQLQSLQASISANPRNFVVDEEDDLQLQYKFLPDLELAKYLLGPEFKSFLETTTGLSLSINPTGLVQLRRMDENSPAFPVHVDNQDEKSLVCILYVSPDWRNHNGGELVLHAAQDADPAGPQSKIVEPLTNRMILFRSEETHWHSVNSVRNWIRYSVLMEWIIS